MKKMKEMKKKKTQKKKGSGGGGGGRKEDRLTVVGYTEEEADSPVAVPLPDMALPPPFW